MFMHHRLGIISDPSLFRKWFWADFNEKTRRFAYLLGETLAENQYKVESSQVVIRHFKTYVGKAILLFFNKVDQIRV